MDKHAKMEKERDTSICDRTTDEDIQNEMITTSDDDLVTRESHHRNKTADKLGKKQRKRGFTKPKQPQIKRKKDVKTEKQYVIGGTSIFKETVLLKHFKNALNQPPIIIIPCYLSNEDKTK